MAIITTITKIIIQTIISHNSNKSMITTTITIKMNSNNNNYKPNLIRTTI